MTTQDQRPPAPIHDRLNQISDELTDLCMNLSPGTPTEPEGDILSRIQALHAERDALSEQLAGDRAKRMLPRVRLQMPVLVHLPARPQ